MKPVIFRSTAARVGAWVWMTFAALNLADIAVRGRTVDSAVAASVLLCGCGAAYVFGLRPRIAADEAGVELRNPLRDVRVPWPALREIEATDAVLIHYTDADRADRTARAWVLQSSPRARAREERRARRERRRLPDHVAEQVAGRTPTQFAVQQLNELAAKRRPKPGQVKTAEAASGTPAWSRIALAALAAPGALLAVMIVIAVA